MLDFELPAELQALRDRARALAAEGVAEFGAHTDSWINGYSKEFSKRLSAEGWIGMTWPTEFGGGGHSNLARMIMGEEMISVGAPIAASWFADRQMGPALINYGTPDQQVEFLPGMLSGETTWCIGMSEPDSGSDLASLKTSAVRDGDVFVVNGQKIWTSFAATSDYIYLICRTTADGPPHKGVSEMIVPMDLPGIEVRPIKDMTTNQHFCEVFFTDVRVPVENLVGVEGAAFKQTMSQLEDERGGIDRGVGDRLGSGSMGDLAYADDDGGARVDGHRLDSTGGSIGVRHWRCRAVAVLHSPGGSHRDRVGSRRLRTEVPSRGPSRRRRTPRDRPRHRLDRERRLSVLLCGRRAFRRDR